MHKDAFDHLVDEHLGHLHAKRRKRVFIKSCVKGRLGRMFLEFNRNGLSLRSSNDNGKLSLALDFPKTKAYAPEDDPLRAMSKISRSIFFMGCRWWSRMA